MLWTSSEVAPPDDPTKAWIVVLVSLLALLVDQVYSAVFDDWAVSTSRTVEAKVTAAYETLRL